MRFSKEFKEWFEKIFELNFPKETNINYYCFNFKAMYDAFNAHNEELKELRAFKKNIRKLQDKLHKYEDDDKNVFMVDDVDWYKIEEYILGFEDKRVEIKEV